jgi:hypothetical protein
LKPENSAIAGLAVVGLVYAVYNLNLGSVAAAHATDPNHPVLESSRKKAGLTSLAMVAAITLITKDANVGILGGGAIILMEFSARHAIMAHPQSGQLVNPNPNAAYEPAENVIPFYQQGQAG